VPAAAPTPPSRPLGDDAGCLAGLDVLLGLFGDLVGVLTLIGLGERFDLRGLLDALLGQLDVSAIRLWPGLAARGGRGGCRRGEDQGSDRVPAVRSLRRGSLR
jgi:hypothetical protein